MAANNPAEYFEDAIATVESGIDSGISPLLVPKNQFSFAINATVRNGFATNRPPYFKKTLSFSDDADLQTAFEKGLWQTFTFYSPDVGNDVLMAAVSGRVFEFSEQTDGSFAVVERTISGDPNPATQPQAWMAQAEQFLLLNDGVSTPYIWDGRTARRAQTTAPTIYGTTSADFTVPAVNGFVTVSLAANYTGPLNSAVYVGTALYMVTNQTPPTAQPYSNSLLKNISGTPGGILLAGTPIVIKGHGVILGTTTVAQTFTNLNALKQLGPLDTTTADTSEGQLNYVTILGRKCFRNGNFYSVTEGTVPFTVPFGTQVISQSPAVPDKTVALIYDNYTIPAVNGVSIAKITALYSGPNSQPVQISGSNFQISNTTQPGFSAAQVILKNLNDTAGNTVVSGTGIASGAVVGVSTELPPGRMLVYGMGRIWESLVDGKSFIATDIVGGSSGTSPYNYRDSVLRVTESGYLAGGGAFTIPGKIGDIRAMIFTATLDVSLGQGPLQIFTPTSVFSCMAPVDRTTWNSLTSPILTQSLIAFGALGQNSTVAANGDTLFRSVDGIRSLILARRSFDTWGNVPISHEVERAIKNDQRDLLPYSSSAVFDNRMLMTCAPQASTQGVLHQGLVALDFNPLSSLRGKSPSVYDGLWTGLNVLHIHSGLFGGVERCFAFCYNMDLNKIELYELGRFGSGEFDNGNTPITWAFESASLFRGIKGKSDFDLVRMDDAEIYIDDVVGMVNFQAFYKPDQYPCWIPWRQFQACARKNNTDLGESVDDTIRPQYRTRIGLGQPDATDCDPITGRPFREFYTCQVKFVISGHCRFLGMKLRASKAPQAFYAKQLCAGEC